MIGIVIRFYIKNQMGGKINIVCCLINATAFYLNAMLMAGRGTINGTLKKDNLSDKKLALLGILLSNPNISLSDVGDRIGVSGRTSMMPSISITVGPRSSQSISPTI